MVPAARSVSGRVAVPPFGNSAARFAALGSAPADARPQAGMAPAPLRLQEVPAGMPAERRQNMTRARTLPLEAVRASVSRIQRQGERAVAQFRRDAGAVVA